MEKLLNLEQKDLGSEAEFPKKKTFTFFLFQILIYPQTSLL